MKSDIKIKYFEKLSEYKIHEIFSLISILNYKVKVFYSVYISFSVLKAALLDDNYSKI